MFDKKELGIVDAGPNGRLRTPKSFRFLADICDAFDCDPVRIAAALTMPYDLLTVLTQTRLHANDAETHRELARAKDRKQRSR